MPIYFPLQSLCVVLYALIYKLNLTRRTFDSCFVARTIQFTCLDNKASLKHL